MHKGSQLNVISVISFLPFIVLTRLIPICKKKFSISSSHYTTKKVESLFVCPQRSLKHKKQETQNCAQMNVLT